MKEELTKQIEEYIDKNPLSIDWNPNDFYNSNFIVKDILEKGLEKHTDELFDYNIDYFSSSETYLCDNIFKEFEDELLEEFEDEDEAKEYIMDNFSFVWDLNLTQYFNYLPDITVLLIVHSNYDCTNSFDVMEKNDGYLWHVYQAVKTGVRKEDMMYEHANGAYGGALFTFAFKMNIKEYFEAKERFNEMIKIPKGTQFGFHSNFQGATSLFDKRTYRNMIIKKQYGDTKYDNLKLVADLDQVGYTIKDVYGHTDFIDDDKGIITL